VLGGWLSDRYGRRRTLFLFTAMMSVPVLYMMFELQRHGWVMPVSVNAANRPMVPAALLFAFWVATMVYNAFNGLMYGIHTALLMDVTNPRVAATQFTAYMAMMNLAISYSATWQGIAIEAWGYPRTMLIDAIVGLLGLALLPFIRPVGGEPGRVDGAAPRRARRLALVLGLACLAWVPYHLLQDRLGAAQPIAGTLFTLVFVGSALFLLAGGALLGGSARRLSRLGVWAAPLLLLMHLRYHTDAIASWFGGGSASAGFTRIAEGFFLAVPVLAGALLLALALRAWDELGEPALPFEAAPA
jgi:PAT family beta-lactamase induction signal transducer AmpG